MYIINASLASAVINDRRRKVAVVRRGRSFRRDALRPAPRLPLTALRLTPGTER